MGQRWWQKSLGIEDCIGVDIERRKKPNILASFCALPFVNESFNKILFDPPFIPWRGPPSFVRDFGYFPNVASMRKNLFQAWTEINRVCKPNGVVLFKWCNTGKSLNWVLNLRPDSLKIQNVVHRKPKGSSGRDKTRPDKKTSFVTLAKLVNPVSSEPSALDTTKNSTHKVCQETLSADTNSPSPKP